MTRCGYRFRLHVMGIPVGRTQVRRALGNSRRRRRRRFALTGRAVLGLCVRADAKVIFFDHPSGWNRIHRAMVWKAENFSAADIAAYDALQRPPGVSR